MSNINNLTVSRLAQEGRSHSGFVVAQQWFKLIVNKRKQPQTMAIMIYADIVDWFSPVFNKVSHKYEQKFKGDKLYVKYETLAKKFGISKDTACDAISLLCDLGLLTREFRHTAINGVGYSNMVYLDLDYENYVKSLENDTGTHLGEVTPHAHLGEVTHNGEVTPDHLGEVTPDVYNNTSTTNPKKKETPKVVSKKPDIGSAVIDYFNYKAKLKNPKHQTGSDRARVIQYISQMVKAGDSRADIQNLIDYKFANPNTKNIDLTSWLNTKFAGENMAKAKEWRDDGKPPIHQYQEGARYFKPAEPEPKSEHKDRFEYAFVDYEYNPEIGPDSLIPIEQCKKMIEGGIVWGSVITEHGRDLRIFSIANKMDRINELLMNSDMRFNKLLEIPLEPCSKYSEFIYEDKAYADPKLTMPIKNSRYLEQVA